MPEPFICTACTNGCRLYFVATDTQNKFLLKGNECKKGADLARSKYPESHLSDSIENFTPDEISRAAALFGIPDFAYSSENFLQGSPERSLGRVLLKTDDTNYILEKVRPEQLHNRKTIAGILEILKNAGSKVSYYYKSTDSTYIASLDNNSYWMLSLFFEGSKLPRTSYWNDDEYGIELAAFITHIRSIKTPEFSELLTNRPVFQLPGYVEQLYKDIKNKRTDILPQLEHIKSAINPAIQLINKLPQVFSHGDPHPMNMIWKDKKIIAAIDWEFCGIKDKLYDIALICGCIGLEHEDALFTGAVPAFLKALLAANTITPGDLLIFPEYLVCQRFAWLSEWLRRQDEDMIQAELHYMEYILENRKRLIKTHFF